MNKICPKCFEPHEKNGRFCSRKCSNSRVFSEAAKQKKSLGVKKYIASLSDSEREKRFRTAAEAMDDQYLTNLLSADWSTKGYNARRLTVILEQNGACNRCGITHWNGKRIVLEKEHIDGDRNNNKRENIEALCPNCHSQTNTWRGKDREGTGVYQARVEKYLNLLERTIIG